MKYKICKMYFVHASEEENVLSTYSVPVTLVTGSLQLKRPIIQERNLL